MRIMVSNRTPRPVAACGKTLRIYHLSSGRTFIITRTIKIVFAAEFKSLSVFEESHLTPNHYIVEVNNSKIEHARLS